MFRYSFIFILIISVTLSSCSYSRTSTYLRKDTIEDRIKQNPSTVIVVVTLPSQLCIDKPNETNFRYSNDCSQYSPVDWYPIDLIRADSRSIVMVKNKEELRKIYELHDYGTIQYNLHNKSNLQFARFHSIVDYQKFKQSHSFLEYQVKDFINKAESSMCLSLLTLLVYPGTMYSLYDLNVIVYNAGQEPRRTRIHQTQRFDKLSWLFFIWGVAISETEDDFKRYTILSPAAQLLDR